jgi:hypothetical protein
VHDVIETLYVAPDPPSCQAAGGPGRQYERARRGAGRDCSTSCRAADRRLPELVLADRRPWPTWPRRSRTPRS